VVECDGDLNQTLQEFPFCRRSGSPDVLQDFVSREELGTIEELQAQGETIAV
jgi:hypothetical protein